MGGAAQRSGGALRAPSLAKSLAQASSSLLRLLLRCTFAEAVACDCSGGGGMILTPGELIARCEECVRTYDPSRTTVDSHTDEYVHKLKTLSPVW